eukprot:1159279-Pelagomonas_calceolata.AAC.6
MPGHSNTLCAGYPLPFGALQGCLCAQRASQAPHQRTSPSTLSKQRAATCSTVSIGARNRTDRKVAIQVKLHLHSLIGMNSRHEQ